MRRYLTFRRSKLNPRKSGILCGFFLLFSHFPGSFFYITSIRLIALHECLPIYIHRTQRDKTETKCYLDINENNQSLLILQSAAACHSQGAKQFQVGHILAAFLSQGLFRIYSHPCLCFSYWPWLITSSVGVSLTYLPLSMMFFLSSCIVFIKVDPGVLLISGFQSIKM